MSERRDPEQVKNLVDGCFERLVADIEAFGGRVDKIIGDAIVALLGAPLAHEDDAERAVRSEEHTSELQSLMRCAYAVFCLKKKIYNSITNAQPISHTIVDNQPNII